VKTGFSVFTRRDEGVPTSGEQRAIGRGRGEKVSPDVLAAATAKAMSCLRHCGPLRSGHDTGANSWHADSMIRNGAELLWRLSRKQQVADTPAQRACPEFRRTFAGAAQNTGRSVPGVESAGAVYKATSPYPQIHLQLLLTMHQFPHWMMLSKQHVFTAHTVQRIA